MYINKDELRDIILQLYRKCREEKSHSRRKVLYGQLYEKLFLWCKYILYKKLFKYEMSKYEKRNNKNINFEEFLEECVKEFGAGIFDVIFDLVELEEEPYNFFYFLNKKLIWKKAEFDRNEIYQKGIKTSKYKTNKVYQIDKYVAEEESKKGGELSEDELAVICEQHRMDIHEYELIKNMKSVQRMIYRSKDTGDDIDTLDTYKPQKKYDPNNPEENEGPYNPEKSFFVGLNKETVCECVKAILDKEKEKRRECCRSLFTLYCIENDWICQELLPVLDSDILASSILDKSERPTQKEIYMKYYPDGKEDSASASSTRMIKEFLADLENAAKNMIGN